MKRKIYKFPNGATLLYRRRKSYDITSCYAGFSGCGLRYCGEQYGLPHFLEHNLFNGTKNRTREQIDKDKTNITFLNAFTNNDCIMTTFSESNRKVEKCFEFSSDVLLNSVFDQKAMDKEKKVVLEEKSRYENRKKFDFEWQFDEYIHPDELSSDEVFGTEKLLSSYKIKDFVEFKKEHFVSEKFVISVCSSLSFCKIKRLANKYFVKNLKKSDKKLPETYFHTNQLSQIESVNAYNVPKENYQVNLLLTYNSKIDEFRYDQNDTFISTFIRRDPKLFFVEARKEGLIYSANCNNYYNPLITRNGYSFSFVTSKFDNIEKLLAIINKTIKSLKKGKFTDEDIEAVRDKRLADLDRESYDSYTSSVSKMLMIYGRRHQFENYKKKDQVKDIKNVNRQTMKNFIDLIFNKNNDLLLFMQGNFEGKDVKTVDYYKSILFKGVK